MNLWIEITRDKDSEIDTTDINTMIYQTLRNAQAAGEGYVGS